MGLQDAILLQICTWTNFMLSDNGFSLLFLRVFLAEQFEFLQPHLDTVMPPAKKPFLQQFYSQVRILHEILSCTSKA